MPKLVDHEQRRSELGAAVWRVIRRDGIEAASVRKVAQEAGWSAGALRHYFSTQTELLSFAIQMVVERIEARVGALAPLADPREAVEQRLHELLPLDKERRAENEVWLAFTGRALVDPQLRARHEEVDEELRRACRGALEELGSAGRLRPKLDLGLEAERLHGLLDGLALHTAMRPERMSPRLIRSVLARHLDSLDPEG
ncbi:MAG: TetR family transcriptional regulator C-terminal domain-containing protein [Solirubrobacterales bacterium]